MRVVILLAGFLILATVFTCVEVRRSRRKADAGLYDFALTVPTPLTDEVRRWLAPQLARRTLYPTIGCIWGLTAVNIFVPPVADELPWYWLASAAGAGAGLAGGVLLAGYRTTPMLDGSVRTVDPVRRRIPEYFTRTQVLSLRLGVIVSVTSLGLAVTLAIWTDAAAGRALLGCGLAAVLVAAHYWVAATVIARPMLTSTPEGLQWQKALLARTVQPMPWSAVVIAGLGAAVVLSVAVGAYRDLPQPGLLCSIGFAALAIGSAAAVVLSDEGSRRRLRLGVPVRRTAP